MSALLASKSNAQNAVAVNLDTEAGRKYSEQRESAIADGQRRMSVNGIGNVQPAMCRSRWTDGIDCVTDTVSAYQPRPPTIHGRPAVATQFYRSGIGQIIRLQKK
jgi:hypothetical protein